MHMFFFCSFLFCTLSFLDKKNKEFVDCLLSKETITKTPFCRYVESELYFKKIENEQLVEFMELISSTNYNIISRLLIIKLKIFNFINFCNHLEIITNDLISTVLCFSNQPLQEHMNKKADLQYSLMYFDSSTHIQDVNSYIFRDNDTEKLDFIFLIDNMQFPNIADLISSKLKQITTNNISYKSEYCKIFNFPGLPIYTTIQNIVWSYINRLIQSLNNTKFENNIIYAMAKTFDDDDRPKNTETEFCVKVTTYNLCFIKSYIPQIEYIRISEYRQINLNKFSIYKKDKYHFKLELQTKCEFNINTFNRLSNSDLIDTFTIKIALKNVHWVKQFQNNTVAIYFYVYDRAINPNLLIEFASNDHLFKSFYFNTVDSTSQDAINIIKQYYIVNDENFKNFIDYINKVYYYFEVILNNIDGYITSCDFPTAYKKNIIKFYTKYAVFQKITLEKTENLKNCEWLQKCVENTFKSLITNPITKVINYYNLLPDEIESNMYLEEGLQNYWLYYVIISEHYRNNSEKIYTYISFDRIFYRNENEADIFFQLYYDQENHNPVKPDSNSYLEQIFLDFISKLNKNNSFDRNFKKELFLLTTVIKAKIRGIIKEFLVAFYENKLLDFFKTYIPVRIIYQELVEHEIYDKKRKYLENTFIDDLIKVMYDNFDIMPRIPYIFEYRIVGLKSVDLKGEEMNLSQDGNLADLKN